MGQKNVSSIIIEITVFQGLNCMQETVIIIGERKGHLNRAVLILSGVSLIWFHCTAIIPYRQLPLSLVGRAGEMSPGSCACVAFKTAVQIVDPDSIWRSCICHNLPPYLDFRCILRRPYGSRYIYRGVV